MELILSLVINKKVSLIWRKWGCIYYGVISSKDDPYIMVNDANPDEIEYQTKYYTTLYEAYQELSQYITALTLAKDK